MWGGGGNKILLDTNKTDMRNQAVREVNHIGIYAHEYIGLHVYNFYVR